MIQVKYSAVLNLSFDMEQKDTTLPFAEICNAVDKMLERPILEEITNHGAKVSIKRNYLVITEGNKEWIDQ